MVDSHTSCQTVIKRIKELHKQWDKYWDDDPGIAGLNTPDYYWGADNFYQFILDNYDTSHTTMKEE